MDNYNHVNLYNTQFSMEILINNIYLFNLVDILKTQELTEEFIVNYISCITWTTGFCIVFY